MALRRPLTQCARRWAVYPASPYRTHVRWESNKAGDNEKNKETQGNEDQSLGDLFKRAQSAVGGDIGDFSKRTASIAEKAKEAAAKASALAAEQAKSAAATSANVTQAARAKLSEAGESEFVKQARQTTEKITKQAQESTSQFFKSDETTDKQEDSKQKPKPSSSSGASGVMGMFKKSVAYVMDAYKEEYRLMRMSETEQAEEKAKARQLAMAAEAAAREAEARARGEDWQPSDETAVMVQQVKRSAWEKRWGWFKEKAAHTGAFGRFQQMKSSPFVAKTREAMEDMRERWETSDNRVVQKLQDMHESMTRESESAVAIKEIRARDPGFDMVRFMARMKEDVPLILTSYLKGDMEKLHEMGNIGDEMLERMGGQFNAWKAEGAIVDHQILDTSDMEMVELKMFGENPIIILRCVCQQINCVRDKFDNVIEGAPDDIQSVHYGWAMEQSPMGSGKDGGPPQWIVREMMVQGMQSIV
mmetsp:Transcript_29005/g.55626  ORF Transcript_29005/g.55626 Transcript_29005/m.55626 type:complete len:475 (-) Transcript_29005:173-1597(-)